MILRGNPLKEIMKSNDIFLVFPNEGRKALLKVIKRKDFTTKLSFELNMQREFILCVILYYVIHRLGSPVVTTKPR